MPTQRLLAFILVFLLFVAACSGGRDTNSLVPQLSAAANPETLPPEGVWLGGDMHVHSDHSADGSAMRQGFDHRGPANVSVADQIGEGERQGLSWMPLTDHRTYTQHYDPLWESDNLLLVPGEEANGSPHANVLGAVDVVVQGGVPEGRPDWSRVQSSIWDAHAQGAIWSHNHPDDGHLNDDATPNERANAVGADTVEIWNKGSNITAELAYAENRWNAGYRFAGVGASDNHFRELWNVMGPGTPTTHVFASEFSERGILQGLKAGRVSVNVRNLLSPFVSLEADFDGVSGFEAIAGDELVVAAGREGVLRATIRDGIGTQLFVFASPGRAVGAVAQVAINQSPQSLELVVSSTDEPQWFYAEVRGPGEVDSVNTAARDDPSLLLEPDVGSDERRAITAPIFIGPTLAVAQGEQLLPTDSGRDDGAKRILGAVGGFTGFADIAFAQGVSHVVAEQHGMGSTSIVYRRSDQTAAAFNLAPESQSARFPKIVASGEDVWVAWQDERAGQVPRRPAIYLRHSADAGESWEQEIMLRALEGRAEKPDLALLPDGQPVVVWQEIAADQAFDVMAQIYGLDVDAVNLSAPGKSTQAYDGIDTRSALYPASVWPKVAVSDAGQIAVAFQDNRLDPDPLWTSNILTGEDGATEVDNFDIAVVKRAPGGPWSEVVLIGDDERIDSHPDLEFSADGRLLLVWDSKLMQASGANLSIRYASSNDGGETWSGLQAAPAVAESTQHMSQYPRLGREPDGQLRVVWYDNRSEDWRWRVMSARYAQGQWGQASLIPSPANSTWPAVSFGQLVFSNTRHAQRMQRDPTQEIYSVNLQ
ncbi:MAG: CehA/McbA family metallohydrolase [Oceanococcus sp.]